MIERLVADWLTEIDERGYQLPFCQVLVSRGYQVLHISSHGPGEHGKDIIARHPDGSLHTFQLKKGDLNLRAWRDVRGEVEDLVRLPAKYPGVEADEPHQPFLVLNGELRGDAKDSVDEYAKVWAEGGAGDLQVIPKLVLQKWFLEAQDVFDPLPFVDFKSLVQIYTADHEDIVDIEKVFSFFDGLVDRSDFPDRRLRRRRAIAAIGVLGGLLGSQYRKSENWVAWAEVTSVTAIAILRAAEKHRLAETEYRPTLQILRGALQFALDQLHGEVQAARTLASPRGIFVEPELLGSRVTLVLGWLGVRNALIRHSGGGELTPGTDKALLLKQFKHLRLSTEAEWPHVYFISLWLSFLEGSSSGESLLRIWVSSLITMNREEHEGVPSPYWSPVRVSMMRNGLLPPFEREEFRGHSYTALSALDCLVRRICRQAVAQYWPGVSRLMWVSIEPTEPSEWLEFRSESAVVRTVVQGTTASWGTWRARTEVASPMNLPPPLLTDTFWLAPLVMILPHRATRGVTAILDSEFGGRCSLADFSPI